MRSRHFGSVVAAGVLMIGMTRAGETDVRAFVGTWKENQAKTRHTISRALTYAFAADRDGFVSIVRANTPVNDRVRFDGKEYPTPGAPNRTVSWTKVSDTLFESTIRRDGVALASARWTLSDGGKHLTQETVPVRANGDNDINIIDYSRSSGEGNTILGVWTPISSRSLVPDLFTITLVNDDLHVFYPKYGYVVYTMRLDGKSYPLVAPTASADASNVTEAVDVRTVRRTTYQAGRATLETVMRVSEDGKTLTATTRTPDGASEPSITVYEKQD